VATIRKRGAAWHAQVRRKGWPTQTRSFPGRSAAERWAREIEGEIDRGVFVSRREAEETTLAEALGRYEREITPNKRGAAQERIRIGLWRRTALASRPLATIRAKDLAAYIAARQHAGASNQTIRLDLEVVSHLFEVARRDWGMESLTNPVKLVRKPAPAPHRERRLTSDEELRLLDASTPELRAAIKLALETAMRRGNICQLQWNDVNFDKRTLRLRETKTVPHTVPLSSSALEVLRALPHRLDGRIFSWTKPGSITDVFAAACRRAGIKNLRFHDLRHEALSQLAERGFDVTYLAAVSGHKSWAALKRYVNLRPEDVARKLG
jgi:integrase